MYKPELKTFDYSLCGEHGRVEFQGKENGRHQKEEDTGPSQKAFFFEV